MFSIEELKEHKVMTDYNLGQAEKDLYQNLILFILYKEHGKELVFKGGTALTKCYGLRRFSEDLDFTALSHVENIDSLLNKWLNRFNMDAEFKTDNNNISTKIKILIKGPLYNGSRQSLCSIQLDISKRENILLEPQKKTLTTFNNKIPSFDVIVMNIKEIAAEKIRAIVTRNTARDLYDLHTILKFLPPKHLIEKKLEYYDKQFNMQELIKRIEEKSAIWNPELKNLLLYFPLFSLVRKEVIMKCKSKYSS